MMFSIGPRTAHSTRSVQLLFLNCIINTAHINALTVAAVNQEENNSSLYSMDQNVMTWIWSWFHVDL